MLQHGFVNAGRNQRIVHINLGSICEVILIDTCVHFRPRRKSLVIKVLGRGRTILILVRVKLHTGIHANTDRCRADVATMRVITVYEVSTRCVERRG